jgi:hypothetical protein
MSLVRNLLLALFDYGEATAQEAKQIKLTEKHIQGVMAAYKDMVKLYEGTNADKPERVEAQAATIAKMNGFAGLDEYDDAWINISVIMSGADQEVHRTSRKDQAGDHGPQGRQIHPGREKKEELAQLEAELKNTKPIQFRENIALVLKYFDKLAPLMQEQNLNLRPAD